MVMNKCYCKLIIKDRFYFAILLLTMLFIINGCSATTGRYKFQIRPSSLDSTQLIWPAPPEIPRYAYIGDILGESSGADKERSDSVLNRIFSAIVGLGYETQPLVDLLRPQQIATNNNGLIYVADIGKQSVFIFDETNGEFLLWDENNLNIPFLSPVGITLVDKHILVSDSEQAQIFKFNVKGEVVDIIGVGVLKRPTGIAFDDTGNRLFVADTDDDNIKIFDLNGKLIDVIGHKGMGPGEFNRPTFIAYKNGLLYVADSLNARVQVMDDTGENIRSIGQRGLYVGNFTRPKGIAIDSDGNIYVTESYYDHVLIYNPQGELLLALGGSGNQPGKFSQPTGIWIDEKDRIFISDMLNHRVSVYQYLGGN